MEISYRDAVKAYEQEFLKDLEALVACPSVRDITQVVEGAPFGKGIRQAFDVFMETARKCGMETRDFGGYACDARIGDEKEYVGIVGHLDVVEPGDEELWETPPFMLTVTADGMLHARGVNDDKGPLLACLYAVRILRDLKIPFRKNLRIIAGGAEETTWECMEHYFNCNPQPVMGFSPDGNFPIVNGEKGILEYDLCFAEDLNAQKMQGPSILQVKCGDEKKYVCDEVFVRLQENGEEQEHTWCGRRALSRNPQKGENALWKFADAMEHTQFLQDGVNRLLRFLRECLTDDYYGEKSGLYSSDAQMGTTSVCPTGIAKKEDGFHLYLDIRYPKSVTAEELRRRLGKLAGTYGFSVHAASQKRLLYVNPDSVLIRSLSSAYQAVTGEDAEPITKGGASYARVLDCGVAFGASFEGEDNRVHMPGECMSLSSLQRATEIYCEAIRRLVSKGI